MYPAFAFPKANCILLCCIQALSLTNPHIPLEVHYKPPAHFNPQMKETV
jgi:hypothetical protein